MSVLEQCNAADPAECNCCSHAYDAGRLRATINLARRMRMPFNWTTDEALNYPVTQKWLVEHFVEMQRLILRSEAPRWQNFPIRHAVLVTSIIQHAPWSEPGRRGAAWAALRAGMTFHHWRLNPAAQDAIELVEPPSNFWEKYDDVLVFAELLDRTYSYDRPMQ